MFLVLWSVLVHCLARSDYIQACVSIAICLTEFNVAQPMRRLCCAEAQCRLGYHSLTSLLSNYDLTGTSLLAAMPSTWEKSPKREGIHKQNVSKPLKAIQSDYLSKKTIISTQHNDALRHCSPDGRTRLKQCFGDIDGRTQKATWHPQMRRRQDFQLWKTLRTAKRYIPFLGESRMSQILKPSGILSWQLLNFRGWPSSHFV